MVFDALGFLRRDIARKMGLLDDSKYNLLWVVDFPLYEYDEEEGTYSAMHHPFTSPRPEDIERLESDPGSVKAQAYDIVLNGFELGGGSIRIHDRNLQERMFKILGLSQKEIDEKFGFLIEAFKYGTPPHGGLAFGLDRLVMLLAGRAVHKGSDSVPEKPVGSVYGIGSSGSGYRRSARRTRYKGKIK